MPMSLGSGAQLPDPYTTPHERFILTSENKPSAAYKKETIGAIKRWRNLTTGQLAISYLEYSSIDLVSTFEQDLDQP